MKINRRILLKGSIGSIIASNFSAYAQSRPDSDRVWRISGKGVDTVKRFIEIIPSVKIGYGPKIYVLSSSLCPYCVVMNAKYPAGIPGFETHYLAHSLVDGESGAVAKVWRNPSHENYRAYMAGRYRKVPAVRFIDPNHISEALIKQLARSPESTGDDILYSFFNGMLRRVQAMFANEAGIFGDFTAPTPSFIVFTQISAMWVRTGVGGIETLQKVIQDHPGNLQ